MIPTDVDSISEAHIEALVSNSVMEGRTIEFKETLPGGTDADKKEFLADVSSFANASGGDIIYGIAQKNGQADQIVGLSSFDEDKELLRLEAVIRNGIQPRILGLRTKVVDNLSAGTVLVIRIPRSWSSPHMVTFKNTSRFYARSSKGKFQLDVDELRSAFFIAGDLSKRVREWRDERVGKIIADETPVPTISEPKMVLHVVPIDSFENRFRLQGSELGSNPIVGFRPMSVDACSRRINLDGFLTFGTRAGARDDERICSYTQLFRSGRVESLSAHLGSKLSGSTVISSVIYEREVLEATARFITSLGTFDVNPPMVIMLTFVGVKGLRSSASQSSGGPSHVVDRDVLLLPDVLIESAPKHLPKELRPIFDAFWNACGLASSGNFDADGNWKAGELEGVPQGDENDSSS